MSVHSLVDRLLEGAEDYNFNWSYTSPYHIEDVIGRYDLKNTELQEFLQDIAFYEGDGNLSTLKRALVDTHKWSGTDVRDVLAFLLKDKPDWFDMAGVEPQLVLNPELAVESRIRENQRRSLMNG